MLLPTFRPRKFTFTPYYYDKEAEEQKEEKGKHRIKFRRILKNPPIKKPISRLVLLVILIIFALYYFWKLVEEEKRTFRIEDVIIEEAPSINK